MEPNPYTSPADAHADNVKATETASASAGIISTTKRRIALAVLSLPILLAIPVRYWAFHIAGNWFVNTDIDPDERSMDLSLMYLLLMAAITGVVILPGLLLLFIDNYRRRMTGCLIVPALIFFILALLVFASMVAAYYRFS